LQRRLAACGAEKGKIAFSNTRLPAEAGLGVRFEYATPGKFFSWSGDVAAGSAMFEADLGAGRTTLSAAASLLSPENALSEAMFF
jgi:hypothetical protein